jgi:hypothetical protein
VAKTQKDDDDVAVDLYRPSVAVGADASDKDGTVVEVRDAAGLSLMHYGYGMEFADEGVTYAKAMAHVLGEDVARDALVEVPPEGGDIDWHVEPPRRVEPDKVEKADSKSKSDSKSG